MLANDLTGPPDLIPLTDTAGLKAAGLRYPDTLHSWRWVYRHRAEHGLQEAFPRIGRRIMVNPTRFKELAAQRTGN